MAPATISNETKNSGQIAHCSLANNQKLKASCTINSIIPAAVCSKSINIETKYGVNAIAISSNPKASKPTRSFLRSGRLISLAVSKLNVAVPSKLMR